MIYTNTQASFGLTSTWKCNFYVASGSLQWYVVDTPTSASQMVTFPVELPIDAIITRAWLSMSLDSPLSGSKYQRVNGISIPSAGEIEIDGITPETTSFEAVFSFQANGVVYQDTQTHSGRLGINNPTLHIEYNSTSHPDEPEEEETIISRAEDRGGQLPRLLDADFREARRLYPVKLRLTLKLNPLSTAVLSLPPDGTQVNVRDFVELFSPDGSAGIFRVTETETTHGYKGGQVAYLEHAFGTLADSIVIGVHAMSAPVATVLATLFASQNVLHWVLGDCEVPEDLELVYEHSYDNLLQAITRVTAMLPPEYAWEFDTTRHPFVAHLRHMTEEDACEGRLRRNLNTAVLTLDTSDLCTQVYPFGAGEGTNRVTLSNLTGSLHLDSETAATWGYVSRTFTSDDIFDALTLRDVAQRYLDRHDHPVVSVTMDASDLYQTTGETFDRFYLGRMCRLALPDYGITMRERVIETEWTDVYGSPEAVNVVLANRIRDASDELAELMREATSSKLIGGSVETIEESARAGEITPGSPFAQSFDITGYGNVLNVKTAYQCETSEGSSVLCTVTVDGNEVDADDATASVVDITRYLTTDANGVPVVGTHRVVLQPKTINTMTSTVANTVTIKQIKKG